MIDYFAILGFPRRPWLEPDALKEAYVRKSARQHPDAGGDAAAFSELNAAYSVLREPAARVRHLLILEGGESQDTSDQAVAPALADLFMTVATMLREVDVFTRQKASSLSPLARAVVVSEGLMQQRDFLKAEAEVALEYQRRLEILRAEDGVWDQRDGAERERLSVLQQELAFLSKWQTRLAEARLQMSL